jgi:hypothetical protein
VRPHPRARALNHLGRRAPRAARAQEEYLSGEEFEKIFGMDKEEFKNMPNWKRISLKKAKGLF